MDLGFGPKEGEQSSGLGVRVKGFGFRGLRVYGSGFWVERLRV